MKNLLVSTAILAALSGTAFAQAVDPATNHTVSDSQQSQSLLSGLLDNATALSASLSNIAENLNAVDGSINVTTGRDYAGLADGIGALSSNGDIPFGSFSQVNAAVYAQDLPANLLTVLNPTILSLGDLSTTAIGAMQSGSITGTINAGGIVDRVSTTAEASTTSATAMAENFGGISGLVSFQNIAVNSGDVNGSVQMSMNDVNATIGKIGTTAIGAMGSGSLTATITGNMAATQGSTAGIVTALVGN
ncbi:hypothetical protein NX862_17410 [Rhodobacter sp. KR11]|uniref:hypothetical protein n=1 Tax=Rhodobacter sp. KR11 TaxID=2974588 RepID=UPI002223233B|nr:hypothetical protein [Rhodobacter sp. KR11]MCW1920539.1 hypothetical protein [Rhodobacter sp. KR11]